jgi:hypothetical protein
MPLFMHYSDTDADVARLPEGVSGCDVCREFATGETQVHVESVGGDADRGDLIFGRDDSAADPSNVEILVKVLDGRPVHAQGETLVHVESAGWLLA